MANQRDLKAFVRYDGSGRVVAGSLVLRKKKPKVGRWQEILTYECCNDTPTTTSTTTVAPTTSTTSSTSTTTTTTTQSSLFAVISTSSCGSGTPITVNFITGTSLCDSPVSISGDFSSAPQEFYIINNGISKLFVRTSSTTADGVGGAPGECVNC
jgi:hypothetical protein